MASINKQILWIGALALTLGCPGGDDSESESGADASASSTGMTSPGTDSMSMTGEPTTDQTASSGGSGDTEPATSGSTSDTTGGSTGTSSGTAATSGVTTTGGEASCDPARGDTACVECVKDTCCDEYLDCENDPDCACFAECAYEDVQNIASCAGDCGLEAAPALWNPLSACITAIATGCLTECT